MLTLQDTLESQRNLVQLCADRPLRTAELCNGNAFYGIDSVLKQYAGLPSTHRLNGVVPHGVVFDETLVWEDEKTAPLPAVFCYPSYRKDVYTRETEKKVILSASPFLYVVEMLKSQPMPERRGTLVFPPHSTHHILIEMDLDRFADELVCLGDEYQPITVCLYWKDFNLGREMPFRSRGLGVVSAGHMFDPDFLFRLYHLCSLHRYAAGAALGSHIFYSVKAGCSYCHLNGHEHSLRGDAKLLKRDCAAMPPERYATLISLFSDPQPATTARQMQVADEYLGADHLKSRHELRKQILNAEVQ